MYRHFEGRCDRDETCTGLISLEVAIPGICSTCLFTKTLFPRPLTSPVTDEELALCERIMAKYPPRHSDTIVSPTGIAYPYYDEWVDPLPDADLEWLMHFVKILERYMWVKVQSGEINREDGNRFHIFATHIVFAYHTALAQFILRVRMNGLRQRQLRPAPEIVREERLSVLLSRLDNLAEDVPSSELAKMTDGTSCPVCICTFADIAPEDGPVIQLPCKHKYCKYCLEEWIVSWDRESALKVCVICREGFGLTDIGDEPPTKKPGFEPLAKGFRIEAHFFAPALEETVSDVASKPGSFGWNVERPWWMTMLLQAAAE
ncbi:hypothetical protein HYALB_00012604 [Hymenoscyphus albidus]|uniref:RING-type domain-containing protein n=1 Tax=Hymenoscyphus albidus TaxID=595503 RepID=A0A9N9Q8G2_9HELO|nr:hypothetical protein HYALB_00012604 [Hymenoscyphus albidus]